MSNHCMVDLETLGTTPGSVIMSLGACVFNTEVISVLYETVSIQSCLNVGLSVDAGAIKFWLLKASQENRNDLFLPTPVDIRSALSTFTGFFQTNKCEYLWSHGSNFDIPVLAAAYEATGHGSFVPWSYRNTRDTRTLFALAAPGKKIDVGEHTGKHNALDDALYQARCVMKAYELLGKELE